MRAATERGLATITWLVAVAAIALGAAGIVAGMEAPQADPIRSGRTAAGDALVVAALEPIEAELRVVAGSVETLAGQARLILAASSGNDTAAADAASAAGTVLVADVVARVARIRPALAAVPLVDDASAAYRLSPAIRDRHRRAIDALEATRDLDGAWIRLTAGAASATRMSTLLADHDAAVARAAEHGRAAAYEAALAALDDADAAIAGARTLRDRLVATVDVTTLDEWLDRSETYDIALRRLYVAVIAADGRVTDAVRAAVAAEQAAKDRLPPDTRSLVIIMAEIGRGGMNESAVAIEQAHADITEALDPPSLEPAP